MDIETLLFTTMNRDDIFGWQRRALDAHPGKRCARIDTWEINNHPCPGGGTFTLYACTMVLVKVSLIEGELRRTIVRY